MPMAATCILCWQGKGPGRPEFESIVSPLQPANQRFTYGPPKPRPDFPHPSEIV